MSFAAIDPTSAGAATGVQDAIARIAELQSLVARAEGAPDPSATQPSNGGASFPAALASASGSSPQQALASSALAAIGGDATTGFDPAALAATSLAPASLAPSLGAPSPFDGLIASAAQRNGVDPAVLKGLIQQESGFDPSATSGAGAVGLAQLMPGTAASLGVTDPRDPAQSIDGAARYLRQQLDTFGGDVSKALAAYNAGPGAVRQYGGIPPYPETQQYVQKVLGYADGYRSAAAQAVPAAPPSTTPMGSIT
ncbi:MAG TPA: lytic transglycosylase domain-containing protein [Conexibacter sp.]|jgi:soluble lytic murein transglycosylase-like protein